MFIALAEDIEEKLLAHRCERHIAEFVDDQQFDSVEVLLQSAQAALISCLHEFVDETAAVVKATLYPFWQAASPSASATCVLPVPDGPSAMQF